MAKSSSPNLPLVSGSGSSVIVSPSHRLQARAASSCAVAVGADQPLAVGGHHVAALGFRDRREEALPFVREHLRDAELIVPVEFGLGQRVDAAHDEFADALGMRLGIGERQRRAPGAAEHQPFVEAAHLAQPLDVGDEMPGGVGVQRGVAASTCRSRAGRTGSRRRVLDRTAGDGLARCVPPGPPCRNTAGLAPLVPKRSQ